MSNLTVFDFNNNHNIRFVEHPDNLFGFGIIASDLAKVLGIVNAADFIKPIENDYKGIDSIDTLGGTQSVTVIWEPGLYQLLAKSRKPQAKPFQKWLFEEVLPTIRKTGQYSVTDKPALPQTYKDALLALVAEIEAKELLEAEKQLLEQENQQLSEAVDELFDYSSILRVAKFNKVSETNFKWRKLKAVSLEMGLEVKQVPCPRFEYKNLYSHDVWRVAYPDFKLPETTTLVIKK